MLSVKKHWQWLFASEYSAITPNITSTRASQRFVQVGFKEFGNEVDIIDCFDALYKVFEWLEIHCLRCKSKLPNRKQFFSFD